MPISLLRIDMLLGYSDISQVKGSFREFVIATYFKGEASRAELAYFRDERDFNHWLADINRQCTGACSVWRYEGKPTDTNRSFNASQILDKHYELNGRNARLLSYMNSNAYSFDYIH